MNASTVRRGPWELSRKGSLDEERHRRRLRHAIAAQLPTVVGQVGQDRLVTGSPARAVRFSVKTLELPRFRHREEEPAEPPAGLGQGEGGPGTVVGRLPYVAGGGGGEAAEVEVEVEAELAGLEALVWEALALPPPLPKAAGPLAVAGYDWTGRRRHGPLAALDRKATLKAALARSQAARTALGFEAEDFRYRELRPHHDAGTRAVVFLLRDASASMTEDKRAMAHALSFWVVRWLARRYRELRLELWLHDTQARPVDQPQFFHAVAAGGTRAASAYRAVAARMREAYPPRAWNLYGFHFTDGEDWDPEEAAAALHELLPAFNLFGLVEVAPALYGRRLSAALERSASTRPALRIVHLNRLDEVAAGLQTLLRPAAGADHGWGRGEVPDRD